jgi:uncharacterized membrane protein (DUF373 family)
MGQRFHGGQRQGSNFDRGRHGSRLSDDRERASIARRGLRVAENAVYVLIALLLLAGALGLVGEAGYRAVTRIGDGVEVTVKEILGTLLLVFILVELLSAVTATMKERKLIAEPFLLVGIIASIKEMVVITTETEPFRNQQGFKDAMLEMGILAAVILVLSVATLLLRRKEREPEE